MTAHAFLLPDGDLTATGEGGELTLAGDEGHHAATVRRIRAGETVLVTDGAGHQGTCTVIGVDRATLTVRIETVADAPVQRPRLVLVQALAKGDGSDLAVRTATELGADEIVPWQADRSVVRWEGRKAAAGREKWRRIVHAAVKQSRRPTIAAVAEPVGTAALADRVATWRAAGATVLLLHEQESRPIGAALAASGTGGLPSRTGEALSGSGGAPSGSGIGGLPSEASSGGGAAGRAESAHEVVVIVGPEGGVSDAEGAALAAAGAVPVRLGREVLRAATAGSAALAAVCALTGRWQ